MERIITEPDNYAPFLLSQGIRVGDLLFISGQAGAGDDGKIVDGGFRAQGEQAFANCAGRSKRRLEPRRCHQGNDLRH